VSLDQLIGPSARPEKIAGGFKFTEGPVFSRRGYLLFSDIPNNRIVKWERGSESVLRENSNGANGLTFDHQGRLLACEAGRVTRTEKDGRLTVMASSGLDRPNDLVYAIDGSIYFSDLPKSRVYQITRHGEVRVAAEDVTAPNGVALSPNQQQLYVADSKERVLKRYEIAAGGELKNGRKFAECRGDGLKTDESGNVWVASEDGLWVFDSSGAKLGVVPVPERPSNCNWGPGFRGLYITARTSVYFVPTKVSGTRTY
jgi:sugar lactone lactonase YvrE